MRIDVVGERDLDQLMPMMRAYCDFYEVDPPDERLLGLARSLIKRPEEGSQLIAREEGGEAVGFATLYWTWSTLQADRIAVMNDLFVKPEARGRRVAGELIEACRGLARERGMVKVTWQTAPDNASAQRAYERAGATREQWVDYWVDVG